MNYSLSNSLKTINNKYINITCSNCNKHGHEFKQCKEPITSWGVIVIKKNNNISDDINFLLIRRKHSLGYAEFIRGRYMINNMYGIFCLFQQMTQIEIDKIKLYYDSFDKLWLDFWNITNIKNTYEYKQSKKKFDCLVNKIDVEISLDFYIQNAKPKYKSPEWGFPKGRKNKNETDLNCAIREFCEETGYKMNDIKIFSNVLPVVENFIGTNGIKYKHIYYLAEDLTDNNPCINDINKNEIGDIGYFNYNDSLKILREYHIEKKEIIKKIYDYYTQIYSTNCNINLFSPINSTVLDDWNENINIFNS